MFRQHDNIFCAVLHASNKAFALMYTNKYVYKKIVTSFQLLIVVWYLSLDLGRWRANKVMTAYILKREMLPVLDIESCLQINIVMRNAIARNSQNLWFQTRLSAVSDRSKVFTPWDEDLSFIWITQWF